MFTKQQAQDYVHGYVKQMCSSLEQVSSVIIEKERELTITTTEGHTFKLHLQELQEHILDKSTPEYSDADIYYYLARKVNAALGYSTVWPIDRPCIYPVIKNTAFIHSLNRELPDERLLFQPMIADLWCCYAVFRDNTFHYITEAHLKYTLHLNKQDLHLLALSNLDNVQNNNAKTEAIPEPLWQITHEAQYADDAGVLLLPQFWEGMKKYLNTPHLAASVSTANCLLFCDANNEEAMLALKQTGQQIYNDANEPLSKCILIN